MVQGTDVTPYSLNDGLGLKTVSIVKTMHNNHQVTLN